jgi:23S rRNA (adenine2503-C2)-methyltransferase
MNLKNLALDELSAALAPLDPPRAALVKIFAAVFAHGASSVEELRRVPDTPRRILRALASSAELPSLTCLERRRARDGFVKYLFESPLGGRFEAVRIPLFDTKYVLCVSSQIGCALGCGFCVTGRMGFHRNLKTWEILDQILQIRREADRPVRGVVFMGMGEPFLNYAEVLRAAGILSHPAGFAISGKAITISTVGIVPGIRRYTSEGHAYRLAFSITSAMPEKRARLLPIEATHPLPDVIDAIREHAAARRDRAMIAYVMIRGVNTGREDAEALRRAFEGIPIKLDLIDVADPQRRYLPPTAEELSSFRDHLQALRCPVARRYSGGAEIGAACGTLAASRTGGEVLAAPS